MSKLVLGLVIWSLAHWFKRLAPGLRASMGVAGKGVVAALSLLAIWLMVQGYKAAEFTTLWDFGASGRGINNLLMIEAVVLMGLGKSKSRLRGMVRHPMLWGVVAWAAAHLVANGDVPSIVLFGGLGAWALVTMAIINRAEPDYVPYQGGTVQGDIRLAVITVVVFAVIAGIHAWIGPSPFTGEYS